MPPRKRLPSEITRLDEPVLSDLQRDAIRRGVELFNEGKYWHAHEAWEEAWLGMGNEPGDDAEILLRGIIQLAASLHLTSIGRLDGAASNLRKAREKLTVAPRHLMGIDFGSIKEYVARDLLDGRLEIARAGSGKMIEGERE